MHLSVAKESFMTTQAVAHSLITTHTCHDCMRKKVKSLSRVGLFATPRTVAYQAPPSMEFSRQEYWSGLPFPSLGDLPDPGIKPTSLTSPALAGRFFTTSAIWEAHNLTIFS